MRIENKIAQLVILLATLTYCSSAQTSADRIRKVQTRSPSQESDSKSRGQHASKKHAPTGQAPIATSEEISRAQSVVPMEKTPDPTPSAPSNGGVMALHSPQPATCGGCHENKRPSATHYAGNDCSLCHQYPSFAKGTFLHTPQPTTCGGCHPRPTQTGARAYPNQGPPPNFNAADRNAIGSGHYVGKDCVECHETPKAGTTRFTFSHSNPNPQVCLPCHFNQGQSEHGVRQNLVGFGSCFGCHNNFDVKTGRNFGRN